MKHNIVMNVKNWEHVYDGEHHFGYCNKTTYMHYYESHVHGTPREPISISLISIKINN